MKMCPLIVDLFIVGKLYYENSSYYNALCCLLSLCGRVFFFTKRPVPKLWILTKKLLSGCCIVYWKTYLR